MKRAAGPALAACATALAAGCGRAPPGPLPSGGATVRFPATWPYPAGGAPVTSRGAMVVSTDSLASAAGLEILAAGGNAVDAAVAVQFALAVANPEAGNIGGGGFLVARFADGESVALDFRETAPARATPDMFLNARGEPTDASWTGHLAAGVPGSVAGLSEAHRRFGRLPWADVLAPAVALARDGFPVGERLAASIGASRTRLAESAASAAIFLPGGRPPTVGSPFRQPDLARTLGAVADSGAAAFYRGWVADSLEAEMRRGGGLVTRADLAAYRAVWRQPLRFEYRGHRIIGMPPPSSGGVTLAEILNILEGFDIAGLGFHSADAIHLEVEAMRRAFEDRNRWLGDPDFVDVPVARLVSDEHADSLRGTIDPRRASTSSRGPTASEATQTTHFSIVDAEGNAVAVTTTLNGSYGSAVVVRGAGFLLNNEMDDFTTRPGHPNAYGLIQGEANAIRPGKRMLSSMAPTIVVSPDGRTELVTGTPGGPAIITTVFQVVSALIDHRLPVRDAVDAPRFHHQGLPDVVRYEKGGLPPEVVRELRRRGHRVEERPGFSGDVQSVGIGPDGLRSGASDRRRGGRALGG
ncbi:MAG: gamma-glutamyltransferase [Gemmatimonadota bacterium]